MIPKIIFRKMSPEENADVIKWAFREDDEFLGVKDYAIKYFPELGKIDDSYSEEEIDSLIENVVKKDHIKYKERLNNEVEKYKDIWNNYNDRYFEAITKYLDIKWPEEFKEIVVSVGFIPVFPRYLDTFTFALGTNISESKLIECAAHESLHFIWFKKFMELFPDTKRREMDTPYIPWQYSEMVVDPILNSKEIKDILPIKAKAYDYFYNRDDNIMEDLVNIYNENISIEDRIRKGFNLVTERLTKEEKRKK